MSPSYRLNNTALLRLRCAKPAGAVASAGESDGVESAHWWSRNRKYIWDFKVYSSLQFLGNPPVNVEGDSWPSESSVIVILLQVSSFKQTRNTRGTPDFCWLFTVTMSSKQRNTVPTKVYSQHSVSMRNGLLLSPLFLCRYISHFNSVPCESACHISLCWVMLVFGPNRKSQEQLLCITYTTHSTLINFEATFLSTTMIIPCNRQEWNSLRIGC